MNNAHELTPEQDPALLGPDFWEQRVRELAGVRDEVVDSGTQQDIDEANRELLEARVHLIELTGRATPRTE
jgi:hypothetical protein